MKLPFSILLLLAVAFSINAQQSPDNNYKVNVSGVISDKDTFEPLPYANISLKGKYIGVVSNEKGEFSFRNIEIFGTDTIVFQYIGYMTSEIPVKELDTNSMVFLKEDIINLNELLVFGNAPDARRIVKNVLVYKDSNYVNVTSVKQAFIRERSMSDLERMEMDYKRSSIPGIDGNLVELVERSVPRQTTSYTDFLGELYFNSNPDDSVKFKIDAIRTVSLKEKDIAELDRIEEIFNNAIKSTGDDEYWKVKTGIISQKIDIDEADKDTVRDTIPDNFRKTRFFKYRIRYWLRYTSFDNDDQWEFLHKTSRYKYTIAGGTRVNGEDVYIIDFEPDNSGMFTGRLYIAKETFALIRADYEYAPDKNGRDIQLFGIGYTENQFKGSIYFEKNKDKYDLKYFSYKNGSKASIDRSFSLLKKRKRFLFDKKLNEIKIGVDFMVNNEESVELLILNNKNLSNAEFNNFSEKDYVEIIHVDQFDDDLWKGYSIIEPTKKMKDYKKHEMNFLK